MQSFGVKFSADVRNGLMQMRNEGFFEDLLVSGETSYLLESAFHALLSPSPTDLHEMFENTRIYHKIPVIFDNYQARLEIINNYQ